MVDPEWLIEENKLERRSQSIQTFSNSSMICLDEIKKLIETGAPKEDLLDTLVTNVNTEANQQIQDPDILTAKKYQSELLLPTFISNEADNFDGVRSSSRRSLHPKIKSPEVISRDELLSPLFSKADTKPQPKALKCQIASVETLSPSEKASINDDFDSISLNLSIDNRSLGDSDENFFICRRSGLHGSRFSLNESIIARPTAIDSLRNEFQNPMRGNSLNIVFENEEFLPSRQPTPTLLLNGTLHHDVFTKPKSNRKLKNPPKSHVAKVPAGNLKRNPSLRYSNYLKNMRVHRNSIHYRGAMLNTHRYRLKASSCPNIYRNSMTTIAKEDEVRIQKFLQVS